MNRIFYDTSANSNRHIFMKTGKINQLSLSDLSEQKKTISTYFHRCRKFEHKCHTKVTELLEECNNDKNETRLNADNNSSIQTD